MFLSGTLLLLLANLVYSQTIYEPTWESIDSRPLPAWYDDAKIGIYFHFGVYAVPAFGTQYNQYFWRYWSDGEPEYVKFMANNYPANFNYPEFANQLKAEFFNITEWMDIIKASGVKYVILNVKHDDGFALWPSKSVVNWNSVDVGPKIDFAGVLSTAARAEGLPFGIQYLLGEFYHPVYKLDIANNFQTNYYVQSRITPELNQLVNDYHPEIIHIWAHERGSSSYWNTTNFVAWLYNESPVRDTVIVNDHWGGDVDCRGHLDITTCGGSNKWYETIPMDKNSYAYRKHAVLSDYYDTDTLIAMITDRVSRGANVEINVGVTEDGKIHPIFELRLRELGEWLAINGEAIYASRPWVIHSDPMTPGVRYTQDKTGDHIYAIVLEKPKEAMLSLAINTAKNFSTVSLLGYDGPIEHTLFDDHMKVVLPPLSEVSSKWAWVLKLGRK